MDKTSKVALGASILVIIAACAVFIQNPVVSAALHR